MGKIRCMLLFVLLCGAAGCVSRGDMQELQSDTADLRRRLVRMEKEMAGVRKTASEEVQNTLKNYRKEMDSVRKGSADAQAAQDMLRVDMREMSGRIDDLKLLVQKKTDEKAFQKDETERRLIALEDRMAKLEKRVSELKPAEAKGKEAEATPEGIYQSGLTAFKAGEMEKAREAFSRIVERYPKHELAVNAQYWIGETFYSEKKYEQAVLAFQEVIKKYPKKDKAPASLLKQAMSFKGLGDVKSARYVLKKLVDDYPKSEDAKKAKELLKELQ
jgi:tol-pal system protein YbgF